MALKANSDIIGLMCVYGGDDQHKLQEAFDSLLLQSIDFQLYLLIDGPVTVDIRNVIKSYQEKLQCIVVENEANRGLSVSLNRIIKLALRQTSAKFFFRMDADDVCSKDRIVKLHSFLVANPDVDVVGSNSMEFENSNFQSARLVDYTGSNQSKWRLAISTLFPHVSVMFRRSFFEKFGLYDEGSICNEDILLWMKTIPLGAKVSLIPEPLIYVRCDAAQHGRRWNIKQLWMSTLARARYLINIQDKNLLHWAAFLFVTALRFTPPFVVSKLKACYYRR